ncbi:MAG: type II toxin-antitoxin system RatA family toxin [Pseudobdellovibrionaceae bacterium]
MASATTTDVFNCTQEEFFKIISDYEKYPEFLSEVKKCEVIQADGNIKIVEFSVSMIKNFKYQMKIIETAPTSMTWSFVSGDIFKTSTGSWVLKLPDDNNAAKTKATYSVDATFNLFVPGPISNALVSVNLPNMVKAYHQRIKKIYNK